MILNSTCPDAGKPAAGPVVLTVARKVTGCPATDGFAVLTSVIAVSALLTMWVVEALAEANRAGTAVSV